MIYVLFFASFMGWAGFVYEDVLGYKLTTKKKTNSLPA